MIVVDTHVLIWLIEGDDQLGRSTRRRIEEERSNDVVIIPAMSVWEMALLAHRQRVGISLEPKAWIDLVLAMPGMALAAMEPTIAVRAATLDWDHRDPADRMIVSTALVLGVPLVTVDRVILRYAALGHLEAIDARR